MDDEAAANRKIVSNWLILLAKHPGDFGALKGWLKGISRGQSMDTVISNVLVHLAMDAEHSDLLYRLFSGGEVRE